MKQRPPARRGSTSTGRGRGESGSPAGLKVVRRRGRTGEAPLDHPAQWTRPQVRTLAVASGKGGVGKSHLAVNLAVALGERGARVLLVDGDFSRANLDLLLGVHPRYDLQDVLSGQRELEDIVVDGPRGVRLVPASSGVPELAELDDFRREVLLRALGNVDEVDLIVMDTASGVSRQVIALCLAAHEVLVATTPEMPAFSDAYGLIKLLQKAGLRHPVHLVVNMAGTPEEGEETAHRIRLVSRRFLRLEVDSLGGVPFDPAVGRAAHLQEPVVLAYPQSPAALAYRALAARLWEGPSGPEESAGAPAPQKLEA